jgi:hypothetical protein
LGVLLQDLHQAVLSKKASVAAAKARTAALIPAVRMPGAACKRVSNTLNHAARAVRI